MHQLGIRHHTELEELPASEKDRWQYFFAVEPAGFQADNWRMGVVASGLINMHLNLPRSKMIKPSDFFPDPHQTTKPSRPATPAAAKALLLALKHGL